MEIELNQENVDAALNRGLENEGQFLDEADAETVAQDLMEYDADMGEYSQEQLLPYVKNWKERRAMLRAAGQIN